MKKNLLKWIGALLIAIVSLGFVSCGDDDEKEDDISIIGTWRSVFKDDEEMIGQEILIFNEDGKGSVKFIYSDTSTVDEFKYIFDQRTMTLGCMYWNDKKQEYNSEIDIYNVSSLTSATMIIGKVGVFCRQ